MDQQFTKKEQLRIRHEEEKARELAAQRKKKLLTGGAIILGILLVIFLFAWLIKESSKPLPGTSYEEEGRTHIKIGDKAKYKTNPPNSGDHYPEWTRAGIFDTPTQDEYLVHSLEHGYIVISYSCKKLTSNFQFPISKASAQEKSSTEEDPMSGPEWKSEECKELVGQLKKVAEDNKVWKLIVMPRPTLDATIALAAWTQLDKFDEFDKKRIEVFINAFRDHGPEKTME
jgi:hypothetical protein